MEYNFILIIISILIIFLLVNYFIIGFFKYKIFKKENFSSAGYPVGFCSHKGKLGIRLYDGTKYKCVSMDNKEAEHVQSNKQFRTNTDEGSNTASVSDDNNKSDDNSITEEESGEPNNNFNENQCISPDKIGKVCKIQGTGVKEIKEGICPGDNVQVTCGNLTYDGVDYSNEGKYSTNCISSSYDMDTMCNVIMPDSIREISKRKGYYDQSAGAQVILKGKLGDCYTVDGTPDLSKSRAICNLKSNKEIKRIMPFGNELGYNKFTDCHNMESFNFVQNCKEILGVNSNEKVFADIHGFDCMPGYARAKCVNKTDAINISQDLVKLKLDSKSNIYPFNKIPNTESV